MRRNYGAQPGYFAPAPCCARSLSHSRSFDHRRRPETPRNSDRDGSHHHVPATQDTFQLPRPSGRRGLEEPGLELLSMSPVVKPIARCSDPLASGYSGGVTNHSDKFAVATGLHPDDTKAILRVVIGDALERGKTLRRCSNGLMRAMLRSRISRRSNHRRF